MENKLKISIITVAYNSESTIHDTISSVLSQTYPEIEYIVVDGNSTDKTMQIVQSFASSFGARMKWISEKDNGLYDAMNKGIQLATGDVIGIINSDDFYHRNDIIERVVGAFLQNMDAEAVFGDVVFVHPDNLGKIVRYYSASFFRPILFRFGFMPPHPSFFTYRRNFDKFGYYQTDYKIAADYELLIRFLYSNGLKYKYLPIDFLKMRMGGKSTSSVKSNWILNSEIVRACKENNIRTSMFLLIFKYLYKISEFIIIKR